MRVALIACVSFFFAPITYGEDEVLFVAMRTVNLDAETTEQSVENLLKVGLLRLRYAPNWHIALEQPVCEGDLERTHRSIMFSQCEVTYPEYQEEPNPFFAGFEKSFGKPRGFWKLVDDGEYTLTPLFWGLELNITPDEDNVFVIESIQDE